MKTKSSRPSRLVPRESEIVAPPGVPLVLCLDVSSMAVGFAVIDAKGNLPAFGVFRARPKDKPEWRIDRLCEGVASVLETARPVRVVMEWSSGKIHGRINRRSTGLSVLGAAQGAIRQLCKAAGYEVQTVSENEWTGSQPKAYRQQIVTLRYPQYRDFAAKGYDPGMDAADAIGIALWANA